jgi:hypothetical protein
MNKTLTDIERLADEIHYKSSLLRFQGEMADLITHSNRVWYVVSNTNTHSFELVSPKLCHRLGYTHREMCERPYFEFMDSATKAATRAAMDDLADTKNNQYVKFANTYITKSGEPVRLEWLDAVLLSSGNWLATVHEV